MSRSVDGVFALDASQTVTFWNQACENMTGIPATHAVGRCCHEVMKGHDLKGKPLCKCDCPLSSLAQGGPPPSSLPMRIERTDGQKVQLKVSTMLVPSSREGQWSIVHVMRHGRDNQPAALFQDSAEALTRSPENQAATYQHQVPAGACLLLLPAATSLLLIADCMAANVQEPYHDSAMVAGSGRHAAAQAPTGSAKGKPVIRQLTDINSASAAQLEKLGISKIEASRIVSQRPYCSKAAVVTSGAIVEATFKRIKNNVVAQLPYQDAKKNIDWCAAKKK
jgi:DNA uptake protein ComE-like DNA-binding protein